MVQEKLNGVLDGGFIALAKQIYGYQMEWKIITKTELKWCSKLIKF